VSGEQGVAFPDGERVRLESGDGEGVELVLAVGEEVAADCECADGDDVGEAEGAGAEGEPPGLGLPDSCCDGEGHGAANASVLLVAA
jgi:hypothetical protein